MLICHILVLCSGALLVGTHAVYSSNYLIEWISYPKSLFPLWYHVGNMWNNYVFQDECYQVRQVFAQKLHKGLSRLRLPLEYMAICALCAKDPVKERRAHARQCLVKNINVRREYLKQHAAVSGKLVWKWRVYFPILPVSVLWNTKCYCCLLYSNQPSLSKLLLLFFSSNFSSEKVMLKYKCMGI